MACPGADRRPGEVGEGPGTHVAFTDGLASLNPDRYGRCEEDDPDVLPNEAASMRGAVGYSETARADGHKGAERFVKLRTDGKEPTAQGVEDASCPCWQTEYACAYGDAPAGSPVAAFLNLLTRQSGRGILHEHGRGRCSEAENSGECRSVRGPPRVLHADMHFPDHKTPEMVVRQHFRT